MNKSKTMMKTSMKLVTRISKIASQT